MAQTEKQIKHYADYLLHSDDPFTTNTTHANMALYTYRSKTATDFFHDATLSVLLQQTLMFIQAELLPCEFHHQDNDDITEASPPSQSFISETHYFDVIANAVALFLNQGKRIWKHLIVIEWCQKKCIQLYNDSWFSPHNIHSW